MPGCDQVAVTLRGVSCPTQELPCPRCTRVSRHARYLGHWICLTPDATREDGFCGHTLHAGNGEGLAAERARHAAHREDGRTIAQQLQGAPAPSPVPPSPARPGPCPPDAPRDHQAPARAPAPGPAVQAPANVGRVANPPHTGGMP
jgi:hypothetical protein